MIRRLLVFLAVLPLYPIQAAAPRGCVAGMSLGSFILEVVPNEKEEARPLAQVNLIRSGDKIRYRPVNLPASFKKSAKGPRRNKFTFWRERRMGRCKAPRRRRCGTSSRSGNAADARPQNVKLFLRGP
jgi:hypothetical protein